MALKATVFLKSVAQFIVSGGIDIDILMPPETGNLLRCFIGTCRFHVQMLQVGQVMALTQLCSGVLESRLEYLYLQQGVVNGK